MLLEFLLDQPSVCELALQKDVEMGRQSGVKPNREQKAAAVLEQWEKGWESATR